MYDSATEFTSPYIVIIGFYVRFFVNVYKQ